MKKRTAAQVERDRIAKLVRRIPVKVGDVFMQWSARPLVVVDSQAHIAITRDAKTGRRSSMQKTTLQMEYARASEMDARRAHRNLAALDRANDTKKKGSR